MLHRFVKMRSDGKHLSIWAYRYIVVAYEWSDPSFALTIFGEMELLGYKADRAAYNAVLVACCQLGKYEEAHHWFMHMADRALEPNAKSYGTMVKVYSSNSEHEEALELFETMRRRCFRPDRFAYHHAIRSCIELQRITYAVELFEDAVKANMTLCVCTYVALISACRQLGHSKLADKAAFRHCVASGAVSLAFGVKVDLESNIQVLSRLRRRVPCQFRPLLSTECQGPAAASNDPAFPNTVSASGDAAQVGPPSQPTALLIAEVAALSCSLSEAPPVRSPSRPRAESGLSAGTSGSLAGSRSPLRLLRVGSRERLWGSPADSQ
ncbi:unnamed protein product, partial [Prorocentrum cordatum]